MVSDEDLGTDPSAGKSEALLTGIGASPRVAVGTAMVARELRLSCVVRTGRATRRIKSG